MVYSPYYDLDRHYKKNIEKQIKKLIAKATSLGLVDVSDSMPWRNAFPEFMEEYPPSVALRGARKKEGKGGLANNIVRIRSNLKTANSVAENSIHVWDRASYTL